MAVQLFFQKLSETLLGFVFGFPQDNGALIAAGSPASQEAACRAMLLDVYGAAEPCNDYAVGTSDIFIRNFSSLRVLEQALAFALSHAVIHLQSWFRMLIVRMSLHQRVATLKARSKIAKLVRKRNHEKNSRLS